MTVTADQWPVDVAGGCRENLLYFFALIPLLILLSGDLLLNHVRNVAFALDRNDQCKGGCYSHRQC